MAYSEVRVTVNATGSVESVTLVYSCGAGGCDESSLNEARHSAYIPKMVNCKPVEGTYEYLKVWEIS
jgi:outer membrane biosynthesis protein TonB